MTKNFAIECLEISQLPDLDPITVYFQDYGPGQGKVTLECWGNSWSSYFGGMGDNTIRSFFLSCGHDYLTNKLSNSQVLKHTKSAEKYLRRVIEAAQKELRAEPLPREEPTK